MAFWSDQVKFREPLRQNRWYLEFGNDPLDTYRFALKECKKPEFEISVTEHRLLTHTLKYPGLLKWKPIDIKFVSARNDKGKQNKNTGESLLDIINRFGYYVPRDSFHQQLNKGSNLLNLNIIQVDANGDEIERWTVYNSFISTVSFGSLTYENDGFVEITMTVQYDWAEMTTKEPPEVNNMIYTEVKNISSPPYKGDEDKTIPKDIFQEPFNPLSQRELSLAEIHNILNARQRQEAFEAAARLEAQIKKANEEMAVQASIQKPLVSSEELPSGDPYTDTDLGQFVGPPAPYNYPVGPPVGMEGFTEEATRQQMQSDGYGPSDMSLQSIEAQELLGGSPSILMDELGGIYAGPERDYTKPPQTDYTQYGQEYSDTGGNKKR